jgi:hypothetical protein
MHIQEPFVALGTIKRPGTMVNGYQRGDGVPASVVEDWDLVVGEQVIPFDTGVVGRPGDGGSRADWQAYAVGQGMDPAEAEAASLEDLVAAYPEPDEDAEARPLPVPGSMPERPDADARKADWVAYVIAMGADKEWANAKGTTKAELQDWDESTGPGYPTPTPEVGDPLAVQATELANG